MSTEERLSLAGKAPTEDIVEEEDVEVGGLKVEGNSHSVEKQLIEGDVLIDNVAPAPVIDSTPHPMLTFLTMFLRFLL